MANRFFAPNQQFADTSGLPYAGGSLTFYASGTSTPLATYSNRALSTPNTNPVVLDSAGRSGDIFLQNLAYKVVLADVNANVIWTADPVYSSDFSTPAAFASGAGSPNGNTAGSQGSPTVAASVYWDTTNNILYVCTVTGMASTAVWTAVNASTSAAVIPPPQGYLTLQSGVPVMIGDSISQTTVYYTPFVGNIIPIYNGASFTPTVFTELSLSLVSSHVANNIYDFFVFNNNGVPTLVTGPSWAAGAGGSITGGSCARGTGAGGTTLNRVNGLWTNAVQITGRNGATTYTINANLGTYVGSILIDGANGAVTCHRTWGQARTWSIWNAYNRVPIVLRAGTSTASWTNTPTTWRQSFGQAANYALLFCGLSEEEACVDFTQNISVTAAAGNTSTANIGIGYNSTTTPLEQYGYLQVALNGGTSLGLLQTVKATSIISPTLGFNQINMIEQAPNGTTNNNFQGGNLNMEMTLRWRG